mmetsp:Transcript_8627/g.20738  ORF Transcript_8627/g.20738 Transcript_8627/m.20738 type:complete len:232 (+) Transcript_8627:152-847(+)
MVKTQKKTKLRPGKGAVAEILTKFIKPKQPIPGDNPHHRSMVILEEQCIDKNLNRIFRFYYPDHGGGGGGGNDKRFGRTLMWANSRFVDVIEEGGHKLLFGGLEPITPGASPGHNTDSQHDNYKEPIKHWHISKARKLLVEDVTNGVIKPLIKVIDDDNDDDDNQQPECCWMLHNSPEAVSLQEVYTMRPEYAEYRFDKFEERLIEIYRKVTEERNRAGEHLRLLEEVMHW